MNPIVLNRRSAALSGILLLFVCVAGCRDNPIDASAGGTNFTASADELGARGRGVPFAEAAVFFEFNTTDNDLGLQVFLDADEWDKVAVSDPGNQKIVQINAQGDLSRLGITELRFESAEPSPAEVLSLFPPGTYTFTGKSVDGELLLSTAELSHEFVSTFTFSPSGGVSVDPANVTVTWDAPGAELIEIIIENEENDHVLDIIVDADLGSLDIPSQFLDSGIEYKIELLAFHENGNRTIIESTFVTQ